MKLASLAAAALTLALPAFAQTTQTLSYATAYGDPTFSLADVACSDGTNGLLTQGYTTLGSLPNFPCIGGVYTVTGWGSPACGTCYEVTYNEATIYVVAVDVAFEELNLSQKAMDALTGGQAVKLGVVDVTSVLVDGAACRPFSVNGW